MKTVTLLGPILLFFILTFSACNERFYGKGNTGTEYAHLQTPFYVDSKSDAQYIQFQAGEALKFHDEDRNFNAHLSIYQAFSNRIVDASFGLNGYLGAYHAQGSFSLDRGLDPDWYPYYGIGFKNQIGFKKIFDNNFQWEYIGIQNHLFVEGGRYWQARRPQRYFIEFLEPPIRFINTLFTGIRWQFSEALNGGLYAATNRNYLQRDEQKYHLYYFMNGPRIGGAINTGVAQFSADDYWSDYYFFGSLSIYFRF